MCGLALGVGGSWEEGAGRGGGKRQRAGGAGAGVRHAHLLGTYGEVRNSNPDWILELAGVLFSPKSLCPGPIPTH